MHPVLLFLARQPWLVKQGLRHLRFGEFSVITGYSGYILWKLGLLGLWKKLFGRKLKVDPAKIESWMPIPEAERTAS